jgi:hypothetical protein
MKKNIKNNHLHRLVLTIMFALCISSISVVQASQVHLSFDSLFPMTWYQKGLESSLAVWQSLITVFEKNSDGALLSIDLLLSRLAFSQFCINRMHQEDMPCIPDDSAYFAAVLHKVKQLLSLIVITPKTHDFVLCADDMIQMMQQKLNVAK